MNAKPVGRPRGKSARQREVQALVAAGVPELEAFTRAGFKYPAREVKRQAATIAESQGTDPREVLRRVAKYGSTADRVAACSALLNLALAGSGRTTVNNQGLILWTEFEDAPSLADVVATAITDLTAEASSVVDDDAEFARAHLKTIISDLHTQDSTAVSAARALLRDNPEPAATKEPQEACDGLILALPDNGRARFHPPRVLKVNASRVDEFLETLNNNAQPMAAANKDQAEAT